MILNRNIDLPKAVKRKIDGPVPGGTFWGIHGMNDAVRVGDPVAFGDLQFMCKNGDIWINDAFDKTGWNQVKDVADLPKFHLVITDDFDGCAVKFDVFPFLPQFYFVPRNRKGRRFLARTQARAWRRKND